MFVLREKGKHLRTESHCGPKNMSFAKHGNLYPQILLPMSWCGSLNVWNLCQI